MENKNNSKIEPIDMTEVLKGYENKWVIISEDHKEVLKSSNNLEDLKEYIHLGFLKLVRDPHFTFSPIS